jgi:hypothetical protein
MDETTRAVTPWYRSPFWLGVIGLASMFVGYQVSVYVPAATPRERRQADKLAEMRGMTDDEALLRRIDDTEKNAKAPPPFLWPGRLLMLAGAVMAVSAAVAVARQPSRPSQGPVAPEPDEIAEEDAEQAERPAESAGG